MLLVTSAAFLLAASSGPVAAADSGTTDESDPVTCQRVQELGSLIRAKRVCMRKSEWKAQRDSSRRDIERSQLNRPTKD